VKILDSVDPDLVVVRHLLRSSGPSGFESHSTYVSIPPLCYIWSMQIFYTTPIIKLSTHHASYAITSRHAVLTANEYENPRPKHSRACLSPRIFLDAIFLRFLFDCCVLAAYFLPSFPHYTVVVEVVNWALFCSLTTNVAFSFSFG
jgi:hypothetical protein